MKQNAKTSNRLKKSILFSFAKRLDLNWCYQCGCEITDVQKFNLAPSVSIQSPEEGSYFDERTEIVFEAIISDNADDPEFLTITWSSDLQGELGGVGVIDDAGYLIFPTSDFDQLNIYKN